MYSCVVKKRYVQVATVGRNRASTPTCHMVKLYGHVQYPTHRQSCYRGTASLSKPDKSRQTCRVRTCMEECMGHLDGVSNGHLKGALCCGELCGLRPLACVRRFFFLILKVQRQMIRLWSSLAACHRHHASQMSSFSFSSSLFSSPPLLSSPLPPLPPLLLLPLLSPPHVARTHT